MRRFLERIDRTGYIYSRRWGDLIVQSVAVQAFLDGRVGFTAIAEVIANTLDQTAVMPCPGDVDDIVALDQDIRRVAGELIGRCEGRRQHA